MPKQMRCPDCGKNFKNLMQHVRKSPRCQLYKRLAQKADEFGVATELGWAMQQGHMAKSQPFPKSMAMHCDTQQEKDVMSDDEDEIPQNESETLVQIVNLPENLGVEQTDERTLATDQNIITQQTIAPTLDHNIRQLTEGGEGGEIEHMNIQSTAPLTVPMNSRYNFIFTPADRAIFRLYDLLEYVGAPRYLMDSITKVMQEKFVQNNFNPTKDRITREAFVNKMMKEFPTPAPIIEKVGLEGKRTSMEQVDVVHFHFQRQLEDILGDHELFSDLENVIVNNHDPWSPYKSDPPDKLDEILDGQWYKDTCGRMLTNNPDEFLMPIVLYVDKTGTDIQQRHGLEPLVFTTAILSRHVRNTTRAWRMMGYIPDLDLSSKAAKAASRQKKRVEVVQQGTTTNVWVSYCDLSLKHKRENHGCGYEWEPK